MKEDNTPTCLLSGKHRPKILNRFRDNQNLFLCEGNEVWGMGLPPHASQPVWMKIYDLQPHFKEDKPLPSLSKT